MKIKTYLATACVILLALAPALPGADAPAAQKKETLIVLSWGDLVGNSKYAASQLDTPEHVKAAIHIWKLNGVDKVLFRIDDFRYLVFAENYIIPGGPYQTWFDAATAAAAKDILQSAVEAAKAEGIVIEMWISIFDEGAPPSVLYADKSNFPWEGRFYHQHPEYLECDRSLSASGRKIHWGVPECAYPEVRRQYLTEIQYFAKKYAFDGIFLSLRSHSPPPEYADQFGFNPPIVDEYQKRYGINILRQAFDLEKWRALRGDYLTQMIREIRADTNSRGQKLSIGVAQGEHIGPPLGNMQIQWKTWVKEQLIDEIMVGHHTLERATYPDRMQRTWGYLQNQDLGIGLPPLEEDLQNNYGPLCHAHNVKLYVDVPLGNFTRTYTDPTMGKGTETPEDDRTFVTRLKNIPLVDGVIVDGRPLSVLNPYKDGE